MLATEENQETKVKFTQNDECILENQVREQNTRITYISFVVYRIFELKLMLKEIYNILLIYKRALI